ncbi:MAG: S1 RNA binding domain protein [Nitriliruptoraceae bacterium]
MSESPTDPTDPTAETPEASEVIEDAPVAEATEADAAPAAEVADAPNSDEAKSDEAKSDEAPAAAEAAADESDDSDGSDDSSDDTDDDSDDSSSVDSDDSDESDDGPREPLPTPDELRVGMIADGIVAKLVDFGAFVDIETLRGTATGLVHVSEVAPGFVENIYAEIGEGDEVMVKVLSIGEDGKIGLSIKQARVDWQELQELDRPVRSKIDKDFDRKLRKFMHGSQSIQGEARRQKRRKLGR